MRSSISSETIGSGRYDPDTMRFRNQHITRREFDTTVAALNERMDGMATQADVDQITQQVSQVATDLESARTTLQTEIDQLAQANPAVDVSALQAAVAPLDAAVQSLGQLQPQPPQQPPAGG